jgi:O-antigen/teichoic acid export membrane protein
MSSRRITEENVSPSALHEAALAGVRWVAVARVVAEASAFGAMVWLAHLISPADFGRAAVALVVSALAAIIAAGGFGAPLVQRPTIDREHLESAQLASIACGGALSLLTFFVSPVVCDPLFGAEIGSLVQLMSPVFLIASLGVVSQSILQRRLDFRRLSLIEMVAVVAGSVTSVALALAGLEAAAIVLGALFAATTLSVLQQVSTPIVVPRWHPRELRDVLVFGVPSALSSLVDVAHRNVDYAILGAKLAPAQVGFYWRAFQLGIDHQRKISGILMRIALPVYARAADSAHRARIRARMVRAQTAVIFPLLATLIAVAPTLIPWMLGERWTPVVVPAQILAIGGMAIAVVTGLGPLMLAAGRPKALLVYNVASAIALASAVLIAAPFGLTVVAVAVTVFYVVQAATAQWLLLSRLLEIPVRQVVADVAPAAICSAATLAIALPLVSFFDGSASPVPVQLLGVGLASAAVYLVLLRLLFRATWSDIMMLVAETVGRRWTRGARSPLSPASLR